MAGRKLSERQARRVRRMQQRHAARATEAGVDSEQSRRGIVISRFGRQVDVEDAAPPASLTRCHIRTNIGSLVAGDRVVWQAEDHGGVVLARLERRSVIERPDAQGKPRPVAANLDQIILVIAPEPPPHANLLDRYMVAAADAGIDLIILLNKTDLLDGPGAEAVAALLTPYEAIGYRVLRASARTQSGLDALQAALAGHTTAFVGQSGVGKSSLISGLLPEEDIRVGELSAAEAKGRHTTTTARLYHLSAGGDLIDSPGIREFSLLHLSPDRTARGFIEFRPWLGQCRFRDCQHRDEPDCAVRAAVEAGHINRARFQSYLQILQEG